MTKGKKTVIWTIILIITIIFAIASVAFLVSGLVAHKEAEAAVTEPPVQTEPPSVSIMDSFDALVTEKVTDSRNAALDVQKVFWIPESAEIAPMPNESCYGQTDDPSSL